MPQRARHKQTSFASGEASPKFIGREDVKDYYTALSEAKNVIPDPQGGFTRKPGQPFFGKLRHFLDAVSLTGATITAPNGGTVANLTDNNPATKLTTTAISAGVQIFVCVHIDFGAAQSLCCFDVETYSAAVLADSGILQVQHSTDDVIWNQLDNGRDVGTEEKSRRFATPPRTVISARFWRIAIVDPLVAIGAFSIGEINTHNEGASVSLGVRLEDFSFSPEQTFTLAFTGRNVDVFDNGVWQAAIQIPHAGTQLQDMTFLNSLDTLILFHEDRAPWRIFRQGSATEWNFDTAPFINIPEHDFGAEYTNGENARQLLGFFGIGSGAFFTLTVEGHTTDQIASANDITGVENNVKPALEALPNVAAGLTVIGEAGQVISVEFTGAGNENREWLAIEGRSLTSSGVITVEREVKGKPGGEPVMSAIRGWPRHGAIYQGRMLIGGFKGAPNGLIWSRLNEFFDLDIDFEGAAGAIFEFLDADDQREIRRFHNGRNLQIFTSTSAHFVDNRTIDQTEPRNYVQSAKTGIVTGAHSVDLQGATIHLGGAGQTIEEFLFSDVEQSYGSENIALVNEHLIVAGLDLAHRTSESDNASDLIFVTRADGVLVVMAALRKEAISGAVPMEIDGLVKSVSVDAKRRVWLAIERTANAVTDIYLEGWDPAALFDAQVSFTFGTPTTSIPGLDHLEAKVVWALVDGDIQGPFTVASGAITLTTAGLAVAVGLFFVPEGVTMPLRDPQTAGSPVRPKRIYEVTPQVRGTGSIAVGINGQAAKDISLLSFGLALEPMMNRLVTGEVRVQSLRGLSETPTVTITQTFPGPLEVLGVEIHYAR